MNRSNKHTDSRPGGDVKVWALDREVTFPRFSRRRLRRQIRDLRSDVIFPSLTLVLLAWMAMVALTLWH